MVNRPLRWVLGVTLVLTAIALWAPDGRDGPRPQSAAWPAPRAAASAPSEGRAALPIRIERQAFTPPERDPFAEPAPPAPVPVPPPASMGPPAPPPAPPPPPPPVFAARYMAQMVTPSGERMLYFQDGEQVVIAKVGAPLSGYVIERLMRAEAKEGAASGPAGVVADDIVAVEVVHPPTSHRQVIAVPPLQRQQSSP